MRTKFFAVLSALALAFVLTLASDGSAAAARFSGGAITPNSPVDVPWSG